MVAIQPCLLAGWSSRFAVQGLYLVAPLNWHNLIPITSPNLTQAYLITDSPVSLGFLSVSIHGSSSCEHVSIHCLDPRWCHDCCPLASIRVLGSWLPGIISGSRLRSLPCLSQVSFPVIHPVWLAQRAALHPAHPRLDTTHQIDWRYPVPVGINSEKCPVLLGYG